MIKILKTFSKLDEGGAETRTLQLIREIKKREIKDLEFHILSLSGEEGKLDQEFLREDAIIHYIKLKELKFIPKFIKLVKNEKFDILYSNLFLFSGVFMLFGRILNVPSRVSHLRTLFDEKENSIRFFRNIILKVLIKKYSTLIIGVNESVLKRNFKEHDISNDKFKVLYNGISSDSPSLMNCTKNNQINIVHVGRQVKAKNHRMLMSIFVEIKKLYPNSYLTLVGKMDDKVMEELNSIIEENSIGNFVNFLGVQNNINKVFENKDLLVFPSVREGLPGVILEALSNGVPVLASDIEPHKEIATFTSNLHVLSLDDKYQNWAKKAVSICSNSPNLNQSQIIEDFKLTPFTLDQHVDDYLKIIYELHNRDS